MATTSSAFTTSALAHTPSTLMRRVVAASVIDSEASLMNGYFTPICTVRHLSVRYLGDVTHLLALGACLAALLRESGTDGVSFKTHLIFLIVFTARFLNVFFCEQQVYLVLFKVLLWSGTLKIVLLMCIRGSLGDAKDTLPIGVLLTPTIIGTLVFGRYSIQDQGLVVEILWIFSTHLEAFAMLPQYVYCYRDGENESWLIFSYVLLMGLYRTIFGLNWTYRYLFIRDYLDVHSMISGLLGIAFFADYLLFKFRRWSPLSQLCISVDDGIRDAQEAAEEMVRGTSPTSSHFGSEPCVVGKPAAKVEIELPEKIVWEYEKEST